MNNKKSKKGFTLMEMLIVVAIIAILIAIAIPAFSSSLKKAKKSADEANLRSAYAEATVNMMENNATATSEAVKIQSDTTQKLTVQGASQEAIVSPGAGEKVYVSVEPDGRATYYNASGTAVKLTLTGAAVKNW